MGSAPAAKPTRRGGRGARERILRAATDLFAREGIHTTGVARLAEVAQVSTRTFYQHFPSKDALVGAYLRRLDVEAPPRAETALARGDLNARDRLLAMFAEPPAAEPPAASPTPAVVRGCPFHNAVVEAAGTMPEVAELVERHKRAFARRLVETAAEAGARAPEALGRQLAVLFEGARALATSVNDPGPIRDARAAAELLIEVAVSGRGAAG